MCLVYNKHATDFLIEKHILNSYYVRVELEELAGEKIQAGGEAIPGPATTTKSWILEVIKVAGHPNSPCRRHLGEDWSAVLSGRSTWHTAEELTALAGEVLFW